MTFVAIKTGLTVLAGLESTNWARFCNAVGDRNVAAEHWSIIGKELVRAGLDIV